MVSLLQELRDLYRSSPQFHRRLDNLISGNEYQQTIASLQGEDLAWLVEYLDEVGLQTIFSIPHSTSAQVLIGIPNRAGLEFKEFLCKLGKLCEMKQVLPRSCMLQGPLSVVSSLSASEGAHNGTRVNVPRHMPMVTPGMSSGCVFHGSFLYPWMLTKPQTFHQATVVWKHSTHPNIVPFLGVTTTPFQLVSDWMPGGNLMEYIENHPNSDRQGFVRAAFTTSEYNTLIPS